MRTRKTHLNQSRSRKRFHQRRRRWRSGRSSWSSSARCASFARLVDELPAAARSRRSRGCPPAVAARRARRRRAPTAARGRSVGPVRSPSPAPRRRAGTAAAGRPSDPTRRARRSDPSVRRARARSAPDSPPHRRRAPLRPPGPAGRSREVPCSPSSAGRRGPLANTNSVPVSRSAVTTRSGTTKSPKVSAIRALPRDRLQAVVADDVVVPADEVPGPAPRPAGEDLVAGEAEPDRLRGDRSGRARARSR